MDAGGFARVDTERLLDAQDLIGCKRFVKRSLESDPLLEGLTHLLHEPRLSSPPLPPTPIFLKQRATLCRSSPFSQIETPLRALHDFALRQIQNPPSSIFPLYRSLSISGQQRKQNEILLRRSPLALFNVLIKCFLFANDSCASIRERNLARCSLSAINTCFSLIG
ncbi:hypothetical protein AXF42_Ash010805 [Apostasia shenzhenica]|uniref:Uncharacterized protein n=1 Tax=Apostasia shenzhenica TaxID=1088818 RepID=A0A2I0A0P0_9ASPA|nr:hypothetical protein AXF42_Ash010805 [Apostasia shenzhenica]